MEQGANGTVRRLHGVPLEQPRERSELEYTRSINASTMSEEEIARVVIRCCDAIEKGWLHWKEQRRPVKIAENILRALKVLVPHEITIHISSSHLRLSQQQRANGQDELPQFAEQTNQLEALRRHDERILRHLGQAANRDEEAIPDTGLWASDVDKVCALLAEKLAGSDCDEDLQSAIRLIRLVAPDIT